MTVQTLNSYRTAYLYAEDLKDRYNVLRNAIETPRGVKGDDGGSGTPKSPDALSALLDRAEKVSVEYQKAVLRLDEIRKEIDDFKSSFASQIFREFIRIRYLVIDRRKAPSCKDIALEIGITERYAKYISAMIFNKCEKSEKR